MPPIHYENRHCGLAAAKLVLYRGAVGTLNGSNVYGLVEVGVVGERGQIALGSVA